MVLLIVLLILSILYCYNISGSNKYQYFWNFRGGIFKILGGLKKRFSLKLISLLIIIKRWHHKCHYYLVIIKNKLKVVTIFRNYLKKIIFLVYNKSKEVILKFLFGENSFFVFKEKENSFLNITFNKELLLKVPSTNLKTFSYIWTFINNACSSYIQYKNIKLSAYQKEQLCKFFNEFEIVSKEEFFDKENNDIIYIYKNYFKKDPYGKILRSNIINFSKKINYSYLVLDVIENYSTMLITYGDPELDLIPNSKDRLALMNVDLNYFISTKEELEILIEALELELKNSINPTFYYRPMIELLIKNLKTCCFNNFNKKEKINYLK